MAARRRLVAEHFNPRGRPKMAFKTREKALKYIRSQRGHDFRAYQCSFCGDWHISTIR